MPKLKGRNIIKTISDYKGLNLKEFMANDIGIEIQDFTIPSLREEEIERISKYYENELKDFKGIRSLHGPFIHLMPISPDEGIKKVSYGRYRDTIAIASKLDMDYIIFHSQINPDIMTPEMIETNGEQNRIFWNNILDETEYEGTILIENIFERDPFALKVMMEIINRPDVRINLDIGHAKLGDVDLEIWVRELKEHIEYIHIHSNDGIYDNHRRPRDIEIKRLYKVLDKYNLNPILSLEYQVGDLEKELERYR